jgi:CheW-like domain
MKRRLETLALLVRCSDLVFAIPAQQVDRIVGTADLEVIDGAGCLQVRVLPDVRKIPGWDLGGLLGKPRRSRETWVICRATIAGQSRRLVLACDRSVAVVQVEAKVALPGSMFDGRRGVVTHVFPCSAEPSVAFLVDLEQLVSERERAAAMRAGVVW